MKRSLSYFFLALCVVLFSGQQTLAQSLQEIAKKVDRSDKKIENLKYSFDVLTKKIEESMWFDLVGDLAYVDKVRLTGPPKHNAKKSGNEFLDEFIENDLVFFSHVFIPKTVEQGKKYPLIVFAHGGIHGNFSTVFAHIVRELVSQGYIIIAPDYRGSTGYGKGFHQSIDYGGRENEDVLASRDYMVNNYSIVDSTKVGLLGWSHGGMITLMNLLQYPNKYACGYAGVPVSDVTYRLEYRPKDYTKLFSASYHVGKTPQEDPQEYARRSPVSYARYLEKPLMITTVKNDDDVSYKEVERMIDSLKFYKKDFEYKIYEPLPGAHVFERIDNKEATDIRLNVYLFLAKYLNPLNPIKSVAELRKSGYRFN